MFGYLFAAGAFVYVITPTRLNALLESRIVISLMTHLLFVFSKCEIILETVLRRVKSWIFGKPRKTSSPVPSLQPKFINVELELTKLEPIYEACTSQKKINVDLKKIPYAVNTRILTKQWIYENVITKVNELKGIGMMDFGYKMTIMDGKVNIINVMDNQCIHVKNEKEYEIIG